MARPPHPDQPGALVFIRDCLSLHGDPGAAVARARYPTVSAPTWGRWLKAVKAEMLMEQLGAATPATASAPATTPAAPSGEPVGAVGEFRAQIDAVTEDVAALRAAAYAVDPASGRKRLRNPVALEKAGRLQLAVADTVAKREEALHGIDAQKRRMCQYNTRVIDALTGALSKLDKEPAREVAEGAIGALLNLQGEMNVELGTAKPGERRGRYLFPKAPESPESRTTLPRVRGNRIVSTGFLEKQQARLDAGEATFDDLMNELEY